jgi:hypothetical protein
LFDTSAQVQIWNEGNDIFQEGLRIISDPERHENLLRGIGSNVGTGGSGTRTQQRAVPDNERLIVVPERFLLDED